MVAQRSRRAVLQGAAGLMFAGLAPAGVARAGQRTSSGGLGLTIDAFEGIYGPGQAGQGMPFYTDPATGATIFAGMDDHVVDYLWLSLGDERKLTGPTVDEATRLVDALLPTDARVRESYAMNESPGSLGQVEIVRMTSRWLDDALEGRSSILVSLTTYPSAGGGDVAIRGVIMVEER